MSNISLWPRVQSGGGRGGSVAPSRTEHNDMAQSHGTFLKLDGDETEDEEFAKPGADDTADMEEEESPAPSQFLSSPPSPPPCYPDDEKRWPLPRPRIVDGEIPNYKPLVLQRRILACLIGLLVALIILVEVSVHMLPNDNSPATLLPRGLERRGQPSSDAEIRIPKNGYHVVAKRGDGQMDQVLNIVETTIVTVEEGLQQPIDGTRVAKRGASDVSVAATMVTPAPQLRKRIKKGHKLADELAMYGIFLTDTWLAIGVVTVQEVLYWQIDPDGNAMLYTDTVPGSGPGGEGPAGPKLTPGDFTLPAAAEPTGVGPLILTIGGEGDPTVVDVPDPGPTAHPHRPHIQQTGPVTIVVPQGSTELTAVLPAPTGHPSDGGAAQAAGQALAAAGGGGGEDERGAAAAAAAHKGQGQGAASSSSFLTFTATGADGKPTVETMAVLPVETPGPPGGIDASFIGVGAAAAAVGELGQAAPYTAYITTLTDAEGRVTGVYTVVPETIRHHTTITLSNAAGVPTATETGDVLETTLYTVPAGAEPTGGQRPGGGIIVGPTITVSRVYYISQGQYFLGAFFPTLVAMVLSLWLRTTDLAAKRLEPFAALARPEGATASQSLCVDSSGWRAGIPRPLSSPVSALTTLTLLTSLIVTPLSSEVLGFTTHGSCYPGSMSVANCAITLAVFPSPARVVIALLAAMALMLLAAALVLRRWRSGVAANPWSIASIAALSTADRSLAALFAGISTTNNTNNPLSSSSPPLAIQAPNILAALGPTRRFKLAHVADPSQPDAPRYGIVVLDDPAAPPLKQRAFSFRRTFSWRKSGGGGGGGGGGSGGGGGTQSRNTRHHLAFLMLSYWTRAAFLLFLVGLVVVIAYYAYSPGHTKLDDFMGSEDFGVKFVFTLIGVLINLFWGAFFTCVAIVSPYKAMYESPQPARRSVLLPPPDEAFTGLADAIKRRHPFLIVVALTAVLSEFLPVLLSQVPWRVTEVEMAQKFGIFGSIGILAFMIIVVLGSFAVKLPYLPVDPSTMAGTLYYVYDSESVLGAFEGTSLMDRRRKDNEVGKLRDRFVLREIRDRNGTERMRIEMAGEGKDDKV